MQTASGQAVKDSSNRNAGRSPGSRARRRRLSPRTMGITAFLLLMSVLVMGASLLGYWPPKSSDANKTVAQQWQDSRTATPSTQYVNELKVEKVGAPRHQVDRTEKIGNAQYELSTVTVTLKVTNNVMMPEPGQSADHLAQATVYLGVIRALFYNQDNGKQTVVGGGSGNVVNLKYGESQTIDVVSTSVKDYTDATQYEAFPDSIWTDKDPVKATPEAGS